MLKDLVLKGNSKEKELSKLKQKWSFKYQTADPLAGVFDFCFSFAEQIAKEKAEILNEPIEYTKEYWIKIFVDAGFQREDKFLYINNLLSKVTISEKHLTFKINYWGNVYFETGDIELNNIDEILLYYNIFRNILNYESNKLNGVNAGGGH